MGARLIALPLTGLRSALAGVCESVMGIDMLSEAIQAARRNAQLNNAGEVEFAEGKCLRRFA